MKIAHLIDFVDGVFDTTRDAIICVGRRKYGDVSLCFKAGNSNVVFAKIKLHSNDLAVDADAVYYDALALGEEIARRWNANDTR